MENNEKNDSELKDEKNNALTEGSNSSSFDDFMKKLTYSTDPYWCIRQQRHLVKDLSCLNEKPVPYRIFDKGTNSRSVILLPENLNANETN